MPAFASFNPFRSSCLPRPMFRVISALVIRDFDYRFRTSPLSGLFTILEPVAFIVGISLARVLIFDRRPIYGESTLLFIATGVLPFDIFRACSQGHLRANEPQRDFPLVEGIDLFIARFVINFIKFSVVGLLIFIGLALAGIETGLPRNPGACAAAVGILALLALGVSLINVAIESYFPLWRTIYGGLGRLALFVSGVVFIVDFVPSPARDFLLWNPLCHAIGWFRLGFYPDYPSYTLDTNYLAMCALCTMIIGVLAFRNRKQPYS